MEKKEYLNEENYQKGKKKLLVLAIVIFLIGLVIGGCIIVYGINEGKKIDEKYAKYDKAAEIVLIEKEKELIKNEIENKKQEIESKKQEIESKKQEIDKEKENLSTKKKELQEQIKPVEDEITSIKRAKFNGFDDAYYKRQDKIKELEESIEEEKNGIEIIDKVLKNNLFLSLEKSKYTEQYENLLNELENKENELKNKESELKEAEKRLNDRGNQISQLDNKYTRYEQEKKSEKFGLKMYYMGGTMVILMFSMMAGSIFMITKRREILAFHAQQVMPIAQEGMEKMAPSVAEVGKTVTKTMAPVYGEVAKEIAKGIKEGMKDKEEDKKE